MSNRKVIDPSDFLECVKRTFTLSDTKLALCLDVGRTTVWRFKQDPNNAQVMKDAEEFLASFDEDNISPKNMSYDVFLQLHPIRKWERSMNARMVSKKKQGAWIRTFYNLCKHLNVLPGKIKIEQCARIVNEQKEAYYRNEAQTKGIYYSSLRESVRGFFMSVHNMSGLYMKNLGIGTEALKGSGKYARQKVPQNVRHKFEQILIEKMRETGEIEYFEALGNCKFNFSTGTRISASLAFSFKTNEYSLTKNKWSFEIFDKGSKGKQLRWTKILMGNLLEGFKRYCSQRFEIPLEDLEDELPLRTGYLFPSFVKEDGEPNDTKIRGIVKPALIEAGIQYKDFPPLHIWRHTFAQEALLATNYNYELVASIGGWVNTRILKGHYGQMGETAREKGLMKMMGLKVVEETHEVEW